MSIAIVTGCNGLIGSEISRQLLDQGLEVLGIDADLRAYFFGPECSTKSNTPKGKNFHLFEYDIRDDASLERFIFKEYSENIKYVFHTAAQPAHDYAVKEPLTDFDINARATVNLLHCAQKYAPESYFVHCSTSKVYGSNPNKLPFIDAQTRYDLEKTHPEYNGIREDFPISNATHSLFGCSKAAGDLYVQEYGRYFGLKTAVFRPGCLTGPQHKGTKLHGFLNYLIKCAKENIPYQIIGYEGKQVRDNIHAKDFAKALIMVTTKPQYGTVYNFGGGRHSNCSILEAVLYLEEKLGRQIKTTYEPTPRIGDHKWYIGNSEKFLNDYPDFKYLYNQYDILDEMIEMPL